VLEPTTVEKVESPEVTTETISDVEMAEDDPAPAAPPAPAVVVAVSVLDGAVVVPVAVAVPEPAAPELTGVPAEAQYCRP